MGPRIAIILISFISLAITISCGIKGPPLPPVDENANRNKTIQAAPASSDSTKSVIKKGSQ